MHRTSEAEKIGAPVAVVVPCWNAEKWIERAICSIINQKLKNIDVIVIDDGSTDGSLKIIKSFGSRVTWATGTNAGPGAARNKGLCKVNADYVLFLDADDYLVEDSMSHWVSAASSSDVVFGPFVTEIDGKRSGSRFYPKDLSSTDILERWVVGGYTPPCSVLWRTSFVRSIGGWGLDVGRIDDAELVMRALLNKPRISVSHDGLGVYVQHDTLGRVSRRRGIGVFEAEYNAISSLADQARAQRLPCEVQALSVALYGLARQGYVSGFHEFGGRVLAKARALGFCGHMGSLSHRVAAGLLGLHQKERLAKHMRHLFRSE